MSPKIKKSKKDSYNNYKLERNSKGGNTIDFIQLEDPKITKEWFYEHYIKPRKPVLIKYKKSEDGKVRLNVDDFKPDQIVGTLDHDEDDNYLQVEELNQGGFGSGQKRLKLKLQEFLDRIKEGESLYLTTQYAENNPDLVKDDDAEDSEEKIEIEQQDNYNDEHEVDDEEEGAENGFPSFAGSFSDTSDVEDMHDDFEDDFDEEEFSEEGEINVDPIYQPPLSNLLNGKLQKLPPHPIDLTESLVPQQINIWFGRTPTDSKQLKISENEDKTMTVNKGLPTENSTSTGLHHDHADNIYVLIQGKKRFTLFSPDYAPDLYTTGDIRCIYDTGVIDYTRNEKAKGWNSVRADGGCVNEEPAECPSLQKDEVKQDPPSFCRIPPALLHLDQVEDAETRQKLEEFAKTNYPLFYPIMNSSIKVTLEDGDLLYLPAGWFHEVTSFGDEDRNNTHVAVNYWFVPPDGTSVEEPYSDKVWEEDFELWKKKYL